MDDVDIVKHVMTKSDDLGDFIAAFELMIENKQYRGDIAVAKYQLRMLECVNNNGCRTYDDLNNSSKRIAVRAVINYFS